MSSTPTYDVQVVFPYSGDSVLTEGETLRIDVIFHEETLDPYLNFSEIGWPSTLQPAGPWSPSTSETGFTGATLNLVALPNVSSSDNYITVNGVPLTSYPFSIDTAAPAVTGITLSDTSLTSGESTLVTVTFSEAVTGFTMADVDMSSARGSLSDFAQISPSTFTMTLTPTPDVLDATNSISVFAGSYTDLYGHPGLAGASSANFTIDTTVTDPQGPEPVISLSTTLVGGSGLEITVLFDEPVQNFTLDDVMVTGAPGLFTSFTPQAGGLEYRMTFVPYPNLVSPANQFFVLGGAYSDLDGNAGLAGESASFMIDSESPYGFALPLPDSTIAAGEQLVVTLQFSEPVTGLDLGDFDTTEAAVTIAALTDHGGGLYTAVFTPITGAVQMTNRITIDAEKYIDMAGNPGVTLELPAFTVDTVAPQAPIISLGAPLVGSSGVEVTVVFDEPVQDFTVEDMAVNGAMGAFTGFAQQPGGLEYRMTFIPVGEGMGWDNQLAVLAGSYQDLAGNAGPGGMSAGFMIDTQRPDIWGVELLDSTIAAGEELVVTLQFSEPLSGLDVGDFDTTEAAVHILSLTDHGSGFYTAVFMPNEGAMQTSNRIVIGDGQYADLAGNPGFQLIFPEFRVDTIGPLLEVTLSDSMLAGGQILDLTIAFDEPVTGFDINDIDVTGAAGALSELIDEGNGIYSVQFTPDPDTTAPSNLIVIRGDYTDVAGNAGADWVSGPFGIDTQAPSLAISLSDTELSAGESQTITFSFSEMVDGFTADDILLDGAAVPLTSFTPGLDGQTFTATYQAANDVTDALNEFSVASGSYTDLLGNAGHGVTSANFSIDTSGLVLYGTAGNDTLIGGAGDDRLSGLPATGTATGKGSIDRLTGSAGADQFVLADALRGVFYNDGSNKSNGSKDYAWITDFSRSAGDKLVVGDGLHFFAAMNLGKTSGTGLYLDTNGNNSWDGKDELIAFIAGVPSSAMAIAIDTVHF